MPLTCFQGRIFSIPRKIAITGGINLKKNHSYWAKANAQVVDVSILTYTYFEDTPYDIEFKVSAESVARFGHTNWKKPLKTYSTSA